MRSWAGVVVPVLMVVACGGASPEGASGSRPSIDQVELDAPVGELVAVGDVLLAGHALGSWADPGESNVLRSTDLGETWEPLTLPDLPAGVDVGYDSPVVVGDRAVVIGRVMVELRGLVVDHGDVYVWTTTDGVEWRGGRIAGGSEGRTDVSVHAVDTLLFAGIMTDVLSFDGEAGDFTLVRSDDGGGSWAPTAVPELSLVPGQSVSISDVWSLEDGRLVAALRSLNGPATVSVGTSGGRESPAPDAATGAAPSALVSDDQGVTWQSGPCPDVAATEWGTCVRPEAVGSLLVRDTEVSIDDGATWDGFTIDPPPDYGDGPDGMDVADLVELPDRGWLAAVSDQVAGDTSYGFLLRSEDGRSWRDLLAPDPCVEDVSTRPNSWFSGPLRFGDRWLVAYSCVDLIDAVASNLYLLDGNGTDPTVVPDSELGPGRRYQQPIAVGDTVVVLERSDDQGPDAIVRLTP